MNRRSFDAIDKKILRIVQEDATLTIDAIAERVHLSRTPCWRRIQRLERDGVIQGRVALLSPVRLGLKTTVFVLIRTNQHDEEWLKAFTDSVLALSPVMEFHRLAGFYDYLLKAVVADIEAYDKLYQSLIQQVQIQEVNASFSMETLRVSTAFKF